jgi:ribonuclease R
LIFKRIFFCFDNNQNVYRYFYSKDKIESRTRDVVLVHIEDWPKPIVLLVKVKVLGKPGEHDTEIHAILAGMVYLNFRLK